MNESGYCDCGNATNDTFCADCRGENDAIEIYYGNCATVGCTEETYGEYKCDTCILAYVNQRHIVI
jgi:hypothetical protein